LEGLLSASLVWQIGLRQLAAHLVHDPVLKGILWAVLFFASGLLWLPLLRQHWRGVFAWPHIRSNDSGLNANAVPAPRLLVDSSGIKIRNLGQ
jgi:hypothetical protein